MNHHFATAFAPASVGNVAVGFDILGHALPVIGDRVRAMRSRTPGVRVNAVTGITGELPLEAAANTAGRAAQSLLAYAESAFGIDFTIEKGIPLGNGLGGSAASAVAAAVAVNELLDPPVPAAIRCVLVHPRLFLSTRAAREMGLPIGGIVLAYNANRTVPDNVESGQWRPRPSVATIANAMDVGDPSNMERLRYLYPEHKTLTARLSATSIDDDATRHRVRASARHSAWVPCPHTAVAAETWHRMPESERRRTAIAADLDVLHALLLAA